MTEIVKEFPVQITEIDNEKNVILLVIAAHRVNEQGETVPLTASQKEAARNAAQAALEITEGTEVLGNSTALLLPDVELDEGETLTLNVNTTVVKRSSEN